MRDECGLKWDNVAKRLWVVNDLSRSRRGGSCFWSSLDTIKFYWESMCICIHVNRTVF